MRVENVKAQMTFAFTIIRPAVFMAIFMQDVLNGLQSKNHNFNPMNAEFLDGVVHPGRRIYFVIEFNVRVIGCCQWTVQRGNLPYY
jgi:hypothetical protein